MEGGGGGDDSTTTRIHVGGLGESVTGDDLRSICSKVGGEVKALDIIRTKGRSFAYIEFLPTSDNSLSKFFSTYNGCVWKGSRLRLEKAKETYLACLKREWEEDAKLASDKDTIADDTDKKTESLEKTKKELSSEKKQLKLFFPRLQKVKSLPFSGTGKHKYSFRRVEVPSLPTHFCDCEEHSGSAYAAEKKPIPGLEEQGGGISKEEFDIMNSVMSKLLEAKNVSTVVPNDNVLTKEEDNSIEETDYLQVEEHEGYSTTDEDDNLIINVVHRKKETSFTDQDLLNKTQASKDSPSQDGSKRKTRKHDENTRNGSVSAVSESSGSFLTNLNEAGTISGAELVEPESVARQSGPKPLWSQKSSWRELIGDKSSSAISISNIISGISSNKEEISKSDGVRNSSKKKKKKLSRHESQRGLANESEVTDKADILPGISCDEEDISDSDIVLNCNTNKKRKLSMHENQRGLANESEVLDKADIVPGISSDEEEISDSDIVLNCNTNKKRKLSRRENRRGQANESEVLEEADILLGISSDKEEIPKSDSVLTSNDKKNKSLSMHENLANKSEVLDKAEGDVPMETQPTIEDSGSNKTGRGSAWLKKASWTQLVSDSSSFSITQILPGLKFDKQEPGKPDGVIISGATDCKHGDTTEKQNTRAVEGEMALGPDIKTAPEPSQPFISGNNDAPAPTENKYGATTSQAAPTTEKKQRLSRKHSVHRTNAGGVVIGETCSFMRTDASLKEWANLKAAITGSHKRKR